jgi:S1-C subfamily serine protease
MRNIVKQIKKNLNLKVKRVKTAIETIEKKIGNLITSIGSFLVAAISVLLVASLLAGVVYLGVKVYDTLGTKHPSKYTVMITNMEGNSGGSGVVLENSPSESIVLTNNHVCKGVVTKGGKIQMVDGSTHVVTGYVLGKEHDICALTVAADLENSIKVADKAPELYSKALITGHPALMPNLITEGHFGNRQIIRLISEVMPCKEDEIDNETDVLICLFFGGLPVLSTYEAQVVSATIMAGSSGSPVLNADGQLSGLVFAGNAEGLSYAFIVPFESVKNFLNSELRDLKNSKTRLRPKLHKTFKEEIEDRKRREHFNKENVTKICETEKRAKELEICKFVDTIVW